MQDVKDWIKIPMGKFKESKIYKNVEDVFNEDSNIDYVVGHSSGGSAALELEKNYPNRKITSVTYNAPVHEGMSFDVARHPENAPLRFSHPGDIVSSLDYNAQKVFKAPEINVDAIKAVKTAITEPTPQNIFNGIKNGVMKANPTLGLHTMGDTYSNPSTIIDFVKSGFAGVSAAKTIGIL